MVMISVNKLHQGLLEMEAKNGGCKNLGTKVKGQENHPGRRMGFGLQFWQ